jgi:MFS family permease
VLLAANAATAAAAALSLLLVHSRGQLWLLYAFAAFYGASSIIVAPASMGLVKDLLPDRDLAGANAALATASQGLRIVSPLAGAGLYTRFGGGTVAVLDAATFVVAIGLLATVRLTESPLPRPARTPARDSLTAGIRYVRATPIVAQVTAAAAAAMLVLGFYESLTFAVITALGKPPSFFGVLMSVQAIGSIIGGLTVALLIRRHGEPRTLGLGLAAWVLASLLYTIPSLVTACAALVIFGIAGSLYAVALTTATQRFTPPALQGRVGATVSMLTNISQTISIAIGAALVDLISYRILLLTVAIVAGLAALPLLVHPASAGAPVPGNEKPVGAPPQCGLVGHLWAPAHAAWGAISTMRSASRAARAKIDDLTSRTGERCRGGCRA